MTEFKVDSFYKFPNHILDIAFKCTKIKPNEIEFLDPKTDYKIYLDLCEPIIPVEEVMYDF